MSRLIDYDAQFREYFDNWYELNRERYTKPEQIEEKLHSLYDEWAAKERAELDKMDIKQLMSFFMQYAECGEVPDLVCEAIVRKGREGEKGLYELYRAGMLSTPAVITIINLLAEMKSSLPYADYMALLSQSREENEIAEAAAEALSEAPKEFFNDILSAFENARSVWARELLMNALVHIKADYRLYDGLHQLLEASENTAFIAAMMAESGIERCLDDLKALEYSRDINYIDYVEICNAIEALGGETARDRQFEGDPYYEMMKSPDAGIN